MNTSKLQKEYLSDTTPIRLYYLNSRYKLGVTWTSFLYLSVLELLCVALLLIFSFLGRVPTYDYYFSNIFHLLHLFSWAGVYACLSKNFSETYHKSVMILYVFNFLMDLVGAIWKLSSTLLCTGAGNCTTYYSWGIFGAVIALVLCFWSLFVFIALGVLTKRVLNYVRKTHGTASDALDAMEAEKSVMSDSDYELLEYYKTLLNSPPPNSLFPKRIVLVTAVIIECIFTFALFIIMMLGMVLSEAYMWSVFLHSIHFFSWMFVISCIYSNYSKNFFRATAVMYLINICLDIAGLTWRLIEIARCDVTTNVDCVFRVFPGLIPIALLTIFLIIVDLVVLYTLSYFYMWLIMAVWYPAEHTIKKLRDAMSQIADRQKLSERQSSTRREIDTNGKTEMDPILNNYNNSNNANADETLRVTRRNVTSKGILKLK